MPLLILLLAALLPIIWLLRDPLFTGWRRSRVRRQPFPPAWRQTLRERVPYFRSMPADLQLQLKKHIQVFLAEKPFIGCGGLVVTDEMRVTIAAQACLLILNRRGDYFANLRQILVYPGAFVVDKVHADGSGVLQDQRRVLAGESWQQGQVILSWQDAVDGAGVPDDGRNVVIHEFAHQLDFLDGTTNGTPPLATEAEEERWATVMTAALAAHRRDLDRRRREPTFFSEQAGDDETEFFADASEAFFCRPHDLHGEAPEVYELLLGYYGVDPRRWFGGQPK